jgi:hypothetical protein
LQQGAVEEFGTKDDDALVGPFDFAAEIIANLLGSDLFEAGMDESVTGGGF